MSTYSNPQQQLPIHTSNEKARREERREARRQRKEREREQAAQEALEKLENTARRMYIAGFFALPLVWLISLLYFYKEHKQEQGSPVIKKYYKNSRLMLILYTTIFVAWFVVFEVRTDWFPSLNILNFSGRSFSGF